MYDADLTAAQNPATPPQQLADIATRRGDLHQLVLAHPQCYPQLRDWIVRHSPAGTYYLIGAGAGAHRTPPRRSPVGCFLIGCGGVVVAVILGFVLLLGIVGAIGTSSSSRAPEESVDRQQSLAAFEVERTRYHDLIARLDGNPVGPLVIERAAFQRLEARADDPNTTDSHLAETVLTAQAATAALDQRITEAAARAQNASGTTAEALVDAAGYGFIDFARDAETACSPSRRADEGRVTVGCVSDDPLGVHIASEQLLSGDLRTTLVVLHELTHLYHRADTELHDGPSSSRILLDQGYFQGSSEVMADCYALTYLDLWTLTIDGRELGYGYVCGEEERRLIREWAGALHAPLP